MKFKPDNGQRNEIMKALSLLSQMGLTMSVCIIVCVFIGKYLDDLLGTSPWLLLVFIVLGVASAFKVLYDLTTRFK